MPSLVLGKRREVGPRSHALEEDGSARVVATQKADGAVPVPERECVGLLLRLVVLGRTELEHRIRAGGNHVRVAGRGERHAELEPPLAGERLGDGSQRRQIGELLHGGMPLLGDLDRA